MGEEFEESNTQVKPLQNNTSYDEMQGNTYVIRPNFQHKLDISLCLKYDCCLNVSN